MNKADPDLHNRLMMARLPAMPQILLKLLERCQSEDVGMSALAELIAKDPAIASKILGIANSSAYHRHGKKLRLEDALSTLGTDMIKTLVISESVFQVFNGFASPNGADLRCFWKHSLTTAVMAASIARKMGVANIEEAYLAGLLHDVGRLALLSEAHAEYAPLFLAPDIDELCSIEHNLLGLAHPEVGAWLADRWQLDSFLSDSLRYHHEPMARVASAPPLIRIVLLAQQMSTREENNPLVVAAAERCGRETADLPPIRQESGKQVARFAEWLGIDLSEADEQAASSNGWNIAGLLAGSNGDEATISPKNPPPAPQMPDAPTRRLAEEIGNMFLSSEVGRTLSVNRGEEAAPLDTVVRSARLLFSFSDIVILRLDASGKTLAGVPFGDHENRMREFSVALAGGGALAECASRREVAFIAADCPAQDIAVEQLRHILASEALVCLPISTAERSLGVLIGGVDSCQIDTLRERERFLKSFAGQISILFDGPTGKQGKKTPDAAREIVHEANNALSIIRNYLGALGGKLEKKGLAVGELSILDEEIDRVGQIIKGLSDPGSEPAVVEINRVIRDVVRVDARRKLTS